MSKHFTFSTLTAMAALLAGSASYSSLMAQTTASVRVIVLDENDEPAAGRRIILESADRSVKLTLTTNSHGEASAAGLLPGAYRIEGRLFHLKADEHAIIRLRMRQAEETVIIEASPLNIETSSVGTQTIFLPQDLERLPLPVHRYVEYSYLAPGISPSGRPEPVVLGSMLDSNAFLIDGMPTNLSSTARFGLNISSEIIESQTMTTGGHKAEIASSAGGIFSIATKTGTNEFKGSVVGYSIWRSLNTRPYAGRANSPEERATDAKEWAVTLSGPIVKNRLFFFGAFNTQLSSLDYENIRPVGSSVPKTRSQEEDRSYRFAKLTWLVGDSHRLEFTYFGDPVTQTSFNTAGDRNYKDEQMANRNRGGDSYLVRHAGALSGALTWENTLGIHKTSFYTYPKPMTQGETIKGEWAWKEDEQEQKYGVPFGSIYRSILDAPNNETFGQYPEERLERQRNISLRSEFTLIAGPNHAKMGFQGLQSEFTQAYVRPSGGISFRDRAEGGNGPNAATIAEIRSGLSEHNNGSNFDYSNAHSLATPSPVSGMLVGGRTAYLYQRTLASMEEYGHPLKSRVMGAYVQDDLQLGRYWVLNLGFRVDQAKLNGEDGKEIFSQNLFSPRLGASWDPFARGTFRFFAYYGRIYSPPTPGNFTAAGATTGGPATISQVLIPSLNNPVTGTLGWRTWQTTGVQGVRNVAVANLKAPRTDMFQLGLEKEQHILGLGTWRLEAVATIKNVRDLIDTYERVFGYLPELDALASTSSRNRVIANLPGLKRDFFGADFVMRRRFNKGHVLQFSYSYGELTGNSQVGNVNSATAGNTVFARIPSLWEDYRLPQYEGHLNESLRHSFKAFGTASLPFSFEISGVFSLRTGLHYSLLKTWSGPSGDYVVLNNNAVRGSETFPSASSLDLALAYNLDLGEVSVRLAVEGFNLANSQPMTIIDNRVSSFGPTNHQQPRAFQFSCRVRF
ncbi:MAG: TonB-dependent receptor [Holophagales bacterium]|jgi:hypothetical protein|nr:TonB-dependent receptor [Holophagales bacterium]